MTISDLNQSLVNENTTVLSTDEAVIKLQNKWYNVITNALHLDSNTFQLIQSNLPVGSTSKFLWDMFNAIPPESVTQYFNGSQWNNFYKDYKAVVNQLKPQDNDRFQVAMADYLEPWLTYKRTLQPSDVPNGIYPVFKSWSELKMPIDQAVKAQVAFLNVMQGPVYQAIQNVIDPQYIDTFMGPKFTKTLANLKTGLTSAPGNSFRFNSTTASSDISHTWAKKERRGIFGFFGGSSSFDKLNIRAASATVTIDGAFEHAMQFVCSPTGWYDSAVLNLTYSKKDNTVWQHGEPSWDSTFGTTGNLKRLVTSLTVVDGIKATITSKTQYSELDQKMIQQSSGVRFWPFYGSFSASSEFVRTTFDANGMMTVKIESPAGNPVVLGVNQLPIDIALGH